MPDTVRIAGVVIRNDEGKYLLVQEAQTKAYGLWNLPAGHVDPGESLTQAALREGTEETGYELSLLSENSLVDGLDTGHALYSYAAEVVGGSLDWPKEELLQAKWLSYDEIKTLHQAEKIRVGWVFDSITKVELG